MQVSKIDIQPRTMAYYTQPMNKIKRRNLREKLVVEYIKSRPAGTRISNDELQRIAGFNSTGAISMMLQSMIKRGIIGRNQIGRKGYSYFVNDAVTVKPADVPAQPKPTISEPTNIPTNLESLARDFSWRYNSDSLREFVKWATPSGETDVR
jgi:hypothetical protein